VFLIGAHWLLLKGIQQCDFHCETLAVVQVVRSSAIEVSVHVLQFVTGDVWRAHSTVTSGAGILHWDKFRNWTGQHCGLSVNVRTETLMILLC